MESEIAGSDYETGNRSLISQNSLFMQITLGIFAFLWVVKWGSAD